MNPLAPTDSLSTNPTLAVLGFRHKIVYHLHFWSLVAVAPLVMVQWQQHHRLLSVLLILFCLNCLLVIGTLWLRRSYFFKGRLYPVLAGVCAVYSTAINGYIGLYWAYPAAAALFFLLPLREATISSVIFVLSMSVVSLIRFPEPDFWRITFSLALTSIFVMIFAWLVGRLQQELARLATTDPLTGCLNRAQLSDLLNARIRRRERLEEVTSLILVNLDNFHAINDQWGHIAGDQVLEEVARRLRKSLGGNESLLRIGGEEFMVLLPKSRQKDADVMAHKLLTRISAAAYIHDIHLTACAGVAEVGRGETWSVWLNRADQALLKARQIGRNQVVSAQRNNRQDELPAPSDGSAVPS
ncbi:GGDEF domain-containing protein [Marinobacter sp.]|uniref:GGDEF domain-containing protein n=1 Tax=Marinobacter sp. TaxID=50741 RepID=UPI0019BD7F73|nr:GGDEF domain-containing protein [Marinobacter sp.]MBC7191095.1 GGDEF domain-containing protein [Marinobacter sp.]